MWLNHSSYSNSVIRGINYIIVFILEDIMNLTCKKKIIENVCAHYELPISENKF